MRLEIGKISPKVNRIVLEYDPGILDILSPKFIVKADGPSNNGYRIKYNLCIHRIQCLKCRNLPKDITDRHSIVWQFEKKRRK